MVEGIKEPLVAEGPVWWMQTIFCGRGRMDFAKEWQRSVHVRVPGDRTSREQSDRRETSVGRQETLLNVVNRRYSALHELSLPEKTLKSWKMTRNEHSTTRQNSDLSVKQNEPSLTMILRFNDELTTRRDAANGLPLRRAEPGSRAIMSTLLLALFQRPEFDKPSSDVRKWEYRTFSWSHGFSRPVKVHLRLGACLGTFRTPVRSALSHKATTC